MKKKIPLAGVIVDAGTQIREALDADHVNDLADAYEEKAYPPPVDVFQTFAGGWILADGFHRVKAATKAGLKEIDAEVHKGERIDALKFALSANAKHGLRRTNADKRRAMEIGFKEFGEKLGDKELAELCGVSRRSILRYKNELVPKEEKVISEPEAAEAATCDNVTSSKPKPSGPPPKKPSGPPPKKMGADGKMRGPRNAPIPNQRTDQFGRIIPEPICALWDRAEEAHFALSEIMKCKGILQKAQDDQDLAFAEVNFSSSKGHLEQAWADIRVVLPHAVCPSCSGLNPAKCGACKGRGFVSKFYWDGCVPKETRELLEKGKAK